MANSVALFVSAWLPLEGPPLERSLARECSLTQTGQYGRVKLRHCAATGIASPLASEERTTRSPLRGQSLHRPVGRLGTGSRRDSVGDEELIGCLMEGVF